MVAEASRDDHWFSPPVRKLSGNRSQLCPVVSNRADPRDVASLGFRHAGLFTVSRVCGSRINTSAGASARTGAEKPRFGYNAAARRMMICLAHALGCSVRAWRFSAGLAGGLFRL